MTSGQLDQYEFVPDGNDRIKASGTVYTNPNFSQIGAGSSFVLHTDPPWSVDLFHNPFTINRTPTAQTPFVIGGSVQGNGAVQLVPLPLLGGKPFQGWQYSPPTGSGNITGQGVWKRISKRQPGTPSPL